MADLEWKLYSLEMDRYGEEIGNFFEQEGYLIKRVNPIVYNPNNPNLYTYSCSIKTIARAINGSVKIKDGERVLALYGSGDLHHFTYGLTKLSDKVNKEYCYIHIDRHHDWWGKGNQYIGCGSFLEKIYKKSHVKKKINNLMFIGNHYESFLSEVPKSKKEELRARCLFAYQIYDFEANQPKSGWLKTVEEMLDNSHEKVYISMDLDVLHGNDFLTNYEPGILRSVQLMQILTLIKMKKKIIGADVVGYIGNNPEKELHIYKTIVNTLFQ